MPTARIDNEWFRCAQCGHKLGRAVGALSKIKAMPAIEIKCSSCKTINYIMIGGQNNGEGRIYQKG